MNPDPEHQKRLKKAAEMMVENQLKMIRMIMIKAAMGIIEGSMEAIEEAEQKPAKKPWNTISDEAIWLEYQRLWPFQPCDEPKLAAEILKFARALETKFKEKNT